MPKVTNAQLKYAQQRLWNAKHKEADAIRASAQVPTGYVPMTGPQFLKAVKRGEIQLREFFKGDNKITAHTRLQDLFDHEILPPKKYDLKLDQELMAAHDKKWNAIMDQAMLGDAEALLRLVTTHTA